MAEVPIIPDALPETAMVRPGRFSEFWRYFRENRGAVTGLWFLVGIVLLAVFAGVVAPHPPDEQFPKTTSRRYDAPDASADVVVACWSAFRGAPADEMAEAARLLRPGGRLLVVHDYGRADEAIIFQVATVQLPMLVRQVRAILAVDGRGCFLAWPHYRESRSRPRAAPREAMCSTRAVNGSRTESSPPMPPSSR